ncbi:MAG: bifunctional molybdenum cofactor biosynthesis protein MoaC/MoaB [Saprospiraceae bacterium]|nr:bifunctional molybdenum cofactor biosynthesis protein MoaC/MoaB [Saprospiraceae bacterium]
MNNITTKIHSLRQAIAEATLTVSNPDTLEAVRANQVPKGNVFEMSRAAGLLAIKKTSDVIPDCHPLPIEFAAIRSEIRGDQIHIEVEVHAIYRTGVEVEAMHGAAVTALTMYDMLKPIDKGVEIGTIRLLKKKGGKSQFRDHIGLDVRAAVIVCSDSVSAGTKTDQAGLAIQEKLAQWEVKIAHYQIIPDEPEAIQQMVERYTGTDAVDLLLFTGGTGLSPRDVTPETIQPMLDREIPGVMEAARAHGQERTPFAMLSRGVAGMRAKTLIITLPGSTNGARETMDALFPYVLHIFRVAEGMRHEG